MKAMDCILAVCCLFLMTGGFAQQKNLPAGKQELRSTASSASSTPIAGTGTIFMGSELEGVAGNMYIGAEWPEGILVLQNGKMMENYRFRYDIYADQMQFISGKDTLAFATPAELASISFDNRIFVYEPYECTGMLMKGYFEQLVPGKKPLLLKRTVSYHFSPSVSGKEESKDTYLITETFFLKKGSQPAKRLQCTRKSAMEAMADQRQKMEAFLKMTGNKVRTPDELKKMVSYYNTLE